MRKTPMQSAEEHLRKQRARLEKARGELTAEVAELEREILNINEALAALKGAA